MSRTIKCEEFRIKKNFQIRFRFKTITSDLQTKSKQETKKLTIRIKSFFSYIVFNESCFKH